MQSRYTPNPGEPAIEWAHKQLPRSGSREIAKFDPERYRLANEDAAAAAIGELYRQAKKSVVDSARCLLECGRALTNKKAELGQLGHGQWLPWLQAHAAVLGFKTDRTAELLMRGWQRWCADHDNNPEEAYAKLASDFLTSDCAAQISNQLWGHTRGNHWNQSKSDQYFTPAQYLDAAHAVLGDIDLDPASSDIANQAVKAKQYFNAEQNGLLQPWYGNVWLNSPYGSMSGRFIGKLIDEYKSGNVTAAIALVSAHATDTDWFQPLWDHPVCFTDHRIAFAQSTNPSGGSVFAYLGDALFEREFIQFGAVGRLKSKGKPGR